MVLWLHEMDVRTMNRDELKALLSRLAHGEVSADDVVDKVLAEPVANLGFARLDLDRPRRTGEPEFIFGAGKSATQIVHLLQRLADAGQVAVATRVDAAKAVEICAALPTAVWHADAQIMRLSHHPLPATTGHVAVVCAGTSDLFVAEEAAVVAEYLGCTVHRIVDVGVAGLHRLLGVLPALRPARVIIAVAGMEGALPTVLSGLVSAPVIGVPTSVGYGAHQGGLTPMMGMLTSCAPGLSVVNIDNGFGAAVVASRINRLGLP